VIQQECSNHAQVLILIAYKAHILYAVECVFGLAFT
jgi:hypothetical protein